jgi:hypothetical protein
VIIVKLSIRLGLVKAGKLVFCYRMIRGRDEKTINMSKAGHNMVLITKQRRYKVRITSKE